MSNGRERRLFPRHVLDEDLFCYVVDGGRLDARSGDISAGGIFIQTQDDVPLETPIAMVFKENARRSQPVYLLGEVVRKERAPRCGVGVRWTQAVTDGAEIDLASFLREMLHIEKAAIRADRSPRRKTPRFVFSFPRVVASSADEYAELNAMEDEDTAEFEGDVVHDEGPSPPAAGADTSVEIPLPAAARKYNRTSEKGPLTEQIGSQEVGAPTEIEASLRIGRKTLHTVITHVGLTSLFVRVPRYAIEATDRAEIRFEVRVRGGMAPVVCRCDVVAIDDGTRSGNSGYDLRITRVDEKGNPGLFERYVRWLHLRSLRS